MKVDMKLANSIGIGMFIWTCLKVILNVIVIAVSWLFA